MAKSKSIIRANFINCILVLSIISILFMIFFISQKWVDFNARAETLDRSYTQYQQDILSSNLENVIKYLLFEYNLFDESSKTANEDQKKQAMQDFEKKLIQKLALIKFGKSQSGNIIIINSDGICLFYPACKNLQGKKISELTVAGEKPFEQMIYNAKLPEGDFLDYTPFNAKNSQARNMAFSKFFAPLGWVICTETSKEDFQMAVAENINRLRIDILIETFFICILAFIVTLAAAYFIYSFSTSFKKEISLLVEYLQKALNEDKKLSEDQFQYSEFKFIASSAIKMVDQIKELLFKLKELALRSEVNSQAKSSFLNSIEHDFRNSMNVIMGMNRILSDSKLDAEQRNCVNSIQASCQSLHSLVNAISDFTTMQSGSLDITCENIEMSLLLEQIKGMAIEKASAIDVVMNFSLDHRIPPFMKGDLRRIKQVSSTLMNTALGYTKQDSQFEFHIGNRKSEEKTTTIVFTMLFQTINASNSNLPPLEKIFDFNADLLKISSQSIGTGFAIAVCKYLVELMNGQISFERIDNEKAKISFNLPLDHGTTEKNDSNISQTARQQISGKINVLLVEDDVVNQKIEQTFLSKLGCEVDTAANGVEALKLYRKNSYSMIFMDCQMPEMNGYEASMAIREIEKDKPLKTPIIALTADASQKDLDIAKSSGMDDHMAKPITVEDLKLMISKYSNLH